MRKTRQPPIDPASAAEWRRYARYVAEVAQIAPPEASDATLRAAATRALDRRALRAPAAMIIDALDAAAEGRPFKPDLLGRRLP